MRPKQRVPSFDDRFKRTIAASEKPVFVEDATSGPAGVCSLEYNAEKSQYRVAKAGKRSGWCRVADGNHRL